VFTGNHNPFSFISSLLNNILLGFLSSSNQADGSADRGGNLSTNLVFTCTSQLLTPVHTPLHVAFCPVDNDLYVIINGTVTLPVFKAI
jgi:hypothetical protein